MTQVNIIGFLSNEVTPYSVKYTRTSTQNPVINSDYILNAFQNFHSSTCQIPNAIKEQAKSNNLFKIYHDCLVFTSVEKPV